MQGEVLQQQDQQNHIDGLPARLLTMIDRHFTTRYEVTHVLRVHNSQLQSWLKGNTLPSARVLGTLTDLGICPAWILRGIGDGYTQDTKGRFLASMVAKGESIIIRRQDEPLYIPVPSEEAE